jgi:hypothetical protein
MKGLTRFWRIIVIGAVIMAFMGCDNPADGNGDAGNILPAELRNTSWYDNDSHFLYFYETTIEETIFRGASRYKYEYFITEIDGNKISAKEGDIDTGYSWDFTWEFTESGGLKWSEKGRGSATRYYSTFTL